MHFRASYNQASDPHTIDSRLGAFRDYVFLGNPDMVNMF